MRRTPRRMGTSHLFALSVALLALLPGAAIAQSLANVQMSLLNQVPDPVQAGDVVDVKIRIQNVGTAEAHNVRVQFVPEYPFSVLEGEESVQTIAALPNWPGDENSRTLTFRLRVDRDAMIGQHSITFRKSVGDGTVGGSQEFPLEVTAKGFAEIRSLDQTKLLPGKITPLVFTVNNLGSAPLKNMVFSWNEQNGYVLPVGTDNSRHIKYLGPGESIELRYDVVASINAAPDLYELELILNYDLTDLTGATSTETVSTTAGVFIGGETDFDVALSDSSQEQTAFTVSNVGSNPAYSVTVRMPQQQGYRVTGSADAIIGNLDKGDYTVVYFRLSAAGMTTGALKVQVDYTDTTGARQTLVKEVSMGSGWGPMTDSAAQAEMMAAHHPETARTQTSQGVLKKPAVYIPSLILLGVVLVAVYRKRAPVRKLLGRNP